MSWGSTVSYVNLGFNLVGTDYAKRSWGACESNLRNCFRHPWGRWDNFFIKLTVVESCRSLLKVFEGWPRLLKFGEENLSHTNKRIINFLGNEGWVSKSQLSKKRYGIIIKESVEMKSFPKKKAKTKLILGKNLNFRIKKCIIDWCKIKVGAKNGWIKKEAFWGILDKENI